MNKIRWGIAAVVLTVAAGLVFGLMSDGEVFSDEDFMFDTRCIVTAYGEEAEAAVDAAFERARQIHNATNAFSESSEVARINSARAGEIIEVSEDIAEILNAARKIEGESGGAFDISIAPVVALWDFGGEGRVPEAEEINGALAFTGADKIIFDYASKTVVKTSDMAKIDLGGVAKGYAGDEVIEVLRQYGADGAIADFGGNISCFGENPESDDGEWRIGLQKPFAPTGEIDEADIINVTEGAVVTSGTYQRYFEKNGKKYHHIIDPETGYPAEKDYSSVTVVTESSLLGDCLSTACFVLGREKGLELAEKFGAQIYFK